MRIKFDLFPLLYPVEILEHFRREWNITSKYAQNLVIKTIQPILGMVCNRATVNEGQSGRRGNTINVNAVTFTAKTT